MTFPRLPDHRRAYSLVERDDGVVFRLYGGMAGPRLPNDITHLVVERELRIPDGIWGGIASGAVRTTFREYGLRAEMLAGLVERVAAIDHPSASQIRSLAAARLGATRDPEVDPAAIAAAATALQVEASRWARLRVGEELSYEWPPRAGTDPRREPRIVRPNKREGRGDGRAPGRGGRPVISVVPKARGGDHEQMDARPDEVIETGAVTLRRYRPDDLDALLEAVGDSYDHLRPWMPWVIGYSRESEAEFLAGAERGWRDGTVYNWAIIAEGVLAGGISLMARIGAGGLEIGYWVRSGYTRRGRATAAAAALVEQAFRLPGVDRVEILHDERNVASGGVPRKLGFTEVGRRPLEIPPPDGTGIGVVWRRVR
ncbi:MAG: GNAT family N-acetyltransferase [Streptosporangiaceae bacterium]